MEIVKQLSYGQFNWAAIIISAITITILIINNEIIKPRLAKKCVFPVPIELIAIVLGTIMSLVLDLTSNWNIRPIGEIPTGFPGKII